MKWPANVCEASMHQTTTRCCTCYYAPPISAAGTRQRAVEPLETGSTDNGATWNTPRLTEFSNTDAKFHFGRLPDGRFYCVNNPIGIGRIPLVLSTARDGVDFDRHYILGDQQYQRRFGGRCERRSLWLSAHAGVSRVIFM